MVIWFFDVDIGHGLLWGDVCGAERTGVFDLWGLEFEFRTEFRVNAGMDGPVRFETVLVTKVGRRAREFHTSRALHFCRFVTVCTTTCIYGFSSGGGVVGLGGGFGGGGCWGGRRGIFGVG